MASASAELISWDKTNFSGVGTAAANWTARTERFGSSRLIQLKRRAGLRSTMRHWLITKRVIQVLKLDSPRKLSRCRNAEK